MELITRPVHSIFFEVEAAGAADGLIAGLCVTELMNFPPRRVIDKDLIYGRPFAGVLNGTEH
jgi:hypothetical protein